MAAKTRRQYAGGAAQTSLVTSITAVATAASIASTTGWPSAAGVPFYVVIDPDTSIEEKCLVTISGSALTMTRGQDGTSAAAHDSGATIYPVFTATDADEANELASKFTAKGDIVTQGASTFTTTTVGTNDQLLKADSSAAGGVAWATYSPTITLGGDLSGSVTLTNLGSATLNATVANNTVALGTDTTGDYVATITGTTNQVSVSGSGSETAAVTLSTPQDIHTGATPTFAGAILSGSSSGDLLRITQTGAGNALLVEDSANPDSTPFVVDASGLLVSGHTAGLQTSNSAGNQGYPRIQTQGTTAHASSVGLSAWGSGSTVNPQLILSRSKSATVGTASTTASGDQLGVVLFNGDDGTEFKASSAIVGLVDGTVSTGVVPGRITFNTASSAGTLTERMRIDSLGRVTIGGSASAGQNLRVATNATGSTTARQILSTPTVQSDVTSTFYSISSFVSTQAASFTLDNLYHFHAQEGTIGAGSTVTNQYGFTVGTLLTGATNNYGFRGAVASGTGRWNLYMDGTAANYLAGRLGVGATLTSGAMAQITNTTAADKAFIIKGAASQTGDLLQLQTSAGAAVLYVTSTGNLTVANAATGSAKIEIGEGRSVDGESFLDLVGDTTYTDFGLRLYRSSGANGVSFLTHRGTGDLRMRVLDAGFFSVYTSDTERMRIDSAGAVGIGATPAAGRTLQIGKTLTGATTVIGVSNGGQIQSDVTGAVQNYRSGPSTAAASFTLSSLTHYYVAGIATPGSGSTITNQYGFYVDSSLTGATSNFAFYGDIASGTSRYNLYMGGTAANYIAGRLGVGALLTSGAMAQIANTTAADKALVVKGAASQSGTLLEIQNSAGTALAVVDSSGQVGIGGTPAAGRSFTVGKTITGSTTSIAVLSSGTIQSDVTSEVASFRSNINTAAASFTLTALSHYQVVPTATAGSGSTITSQYGFNVASTMTGATNNYGFYGDIAAASGRWNFYANGTARNYFAGGLEVVAGTTSMTTGFTHVPAAAGAPTGAPTNPTGNTPLYYDTTNNKLYVYNGAWKSVSLT